MRFYSLTHNEMFYLVIFYNPRKSAESGDQKRIKSAVIYFLGVTTVCGSRKINILVFFETICQMEVCVHHMGSQAMQ